MHITFTVRYGPEVTSKIVSHKDAVGKTIIGASSLVRSGAAYQGGPTSVCVHS